MSDENKDIISRLKYLEAEMKLLKQQQAELLYHSTIIKNTKLNQPLVKVEGPASENPIPDKIAHQKPSEPMTKQPKKEFDLEKSLSQWLPRVFMFILLLGVLWGLKVGMDNGFITNPVRIVMGYAGTVFLYFVGMRYYGKKNKVFGLTLLGGLVALGILTTFAAHHLYGYFSFFVAFVVGVVYIAAGLFLSEKTKSETLAFFSAIGGFLLPFLLKGEGVSSLQFCAYIFLLFLTLFYVSIRQRHKYTFYVTFLLFHITLLTFGILDGSDVDRPIIVGTVLIQHVLLLFFYLKGEISRKIFSETLIYSNFVFTIGWIKILDDNQVTSIYGLLALLYVALAIYSFRKSDELLRGVLSAVAIFAVSVFVLSFNFENHSTQLVLLLVNGTVGLWVGMRFKTLRTIITSSFIYLLTAITILLTTTINEFISVEHLVWVVFIFTIVFNYYTAYQFLPEFTKVKIKTIDKSLIVGQVISLIYIIKLTSLSLVNVGFTFTTTLHIYLLVMIIALCVMYLFHMSSKGVFVTTAVVIEFLFLGIFILTPDFASYLGKGAYWFSLSVEVLYVGILTVLFLSIMKDWFFIRKEKFIERLPILAVIMQAIYFIFLNKWYLKLTSVYDWDMEFIFLVHTFLLFAFSFVSISFGRKKNWKHVKVIGAVLIVVCVVKLFTLDLQSVSILVRAILFTIVGVVGLVYSRTLFKE